MPNKPAPKDVWVIRVAYAGQISGYGQVIYGTKRDAFREFDRKASGYDKTVSISVHGLTPAIKSGGGKFRQRVEK